MIRLSKSVVLDKSFNFGLKIIKLYMKLRSKNEFTLSNQLVKSATSIGANITEAQYAQSRKDFINKMGIALKEANETEYWLKLLSKSDIIEEIEYENYIKDCLEIKMILISIVKSSKDSLIHRR
ncbi:four helix bundle protein [Clostridium tertium]|uniref:four helix bundle protein n=1 Tax=Clostridium TaxID=1485 RepID=UPI0022E1A607|nr:MULTISPECIES: four helix bundle protein [Clostridium]MDB1925018.1 four helix bundle protein [Clostridium tertium]MDB1945466.1 four helix bundle protein [Clostridium tertium]MDB1951951.1 four helix bundle protein [Clostridium tertium]MDU1277298.1 four helix bundle protein [Clostridium sp.]MDU3526939.1 four helix bundle protein [Clostridium sp.]